MRTYYFHFVAKTTLPDGEGAVFENDQVAFAHAESLAKELARTEILSGCAIVVTNEDQDELYEVALDHETHRTH